MTRTWSNLVLETRVEYGAAAHRNRGRYSGQKIHRLICEYVVGVVDEDAAMLSGGVGRDFLVGVRTRDEIGRTVRIPRQPVLFSCHPACMCTQGQHVGQPNARLTAENVNCIKCGGKA